MGRVLQPSIVLALVFATVSLPARTFAQEDDPESRSRQAFAEGVELFKSKNYEQALARFEESYSLRPEAVVLFNIGMICKALARYAEAIVHLRRFVQSSQADQAALRDKAQGAIAEMSGSVGWLVVEGALSQASVSVNGRFVGLVKEGPFPLDPGKNEVTVEAPQHVPVTAQVLAMAGQDCRVRAPLDLLEHVVVATPPEPEDDETETRIEPQTESKTDARPKEKKHSPVRPLAVTATVVAATAVVAIVPLSVLTHNDYETARSSWNDFSKETTSQQAADRYNDDAEDAYRSLGLTLGVAGTAAALGILSTVLWVRDNRQRGSMALEVDWLGAELILRF